MCVPLGLLNGFVAKKFSHGEKVYPILDSMASEGMAVAIRDVGANFRLSLPSECNAVRSCREFFCTASKPVTVYYLNEAGCNHWGSSLGNKGRSIPDQRPVWNAS